MDINELESFKLSDAVKFHDNLNPALWTKNGELLLGLCILTGKQIGRAHV